MKTLVASIVVLFVVAGCTTTGTLDKEPGITTKIGDVKCGVEIDGKLKLCEEAE